MKKFFKFFYIVLASIMIMPVFAACNSEGGIQTLSVRFTSDVYEVEYNVPTKIGYHIYPSTATNNRVEITFELEQADGIFDKKNLTFTLVDPERTEDIEATIVVNNTYSDTCILRPKIYPREIRFENASDYVNCGGIYGLQLKGVFTDGEKSMSPDLYNLEITSSDPSVLRVEGLNVVSTGKLGSALIEARVKNAKGEYVVNDSTLDEPEILYASVNLTVEPNVESAKIALQGQSEFMTAYVNSYTRTNENTHLTRQSSVMMMVELYSADNYLVEHSVLDVISVTPSVARVVRDENQNNLFTIHLVAPEESSTTPYVRIEIVTSATNSSGNPIKFVFFIARQSLSS